MSDISKHQGENNGIDMDLIRAEIDAEAEQWRRQDPNIAQLEKDIERAWFDIAPVGAVIRDDQILDKFEALGTVNITAPIEPRRHIRVVKRFIQRSILWYIQYVVGQINSLLKLLQKALRQMHSRIEALEATTSPYTENPNYSRAAPELTPEVAKLVAALVAKKRCAVLSCGSGSALEAIYKAGGGGYGIEPDEQMVIVAAGRGLDVRQGSVVDHISNLKDNSIEALLLAGAVEEQPMGILVKMVSEVKRVLTDSGVVVIAVAPLESRTTPERELLFGCGLSPESWQYLVEQNGLTTRMVSTGDLRVPVLVFGQAP